MEDKNLEVKPIKTTIRNILITVGISMVVVFAVGILWKNTRSKPGTEVAKNQKMGASTSIVNGIVEYSTDKISWSRLKTSDSLQEGQYIRTDVDGRAVVSLDDGSAIRINNDSMIRLSSLSPSNIRISNLAGEVYTRVVKYDRKFAVDVEDESYVALGTAYKTINREKIKGLEVYQSSVEAQKAKQSVPEGKQYFDANLVSELTKQIVDIPLEQMQKDAFMQWNLEEDKKDSIFKDKLGHLKKLEESPTAIAPPPPATEPTPAPALKPKPETPKGSITINGSSVSNGINVSWTVTNISVTNGFKLVFGSAPNPTFGMNEAVYLSDSNLRSYTLSIKDGKTYHFRICTYTGSGCINYSNDIVVTAPYVAPNPPTGTLSLISTGATSLGWTLTGSAPYGLKLVWSPNSGPTYPGSSAKFYNEGNTTSATIDASTGTYYVRVCMYYEGSCLNYSNELTVTIP